MRNKTSQQKAIVAQRERTESLLKEEQQKNRTKRLFEVNNSVFSKSLYMKLGRDVTKKLNGYDTIKEYQNVIEKCKATWFSTNALRKGINKKIQEEYINAIKNGNKVYLYFVIGISGGGCNKLEYQAEIIEIKSMAGGMKTPEPNLTPDIWSDIPSSIWIKLKKIEKIDDLEVSDFIFCKNKKNLMDVLGTQCHFGYIQKKNAL